MKKIELRFSFGIMLICLFVLLMPQQTFASSASYKSLWDEDANAYLISSVEELKIFRDSLAEHDYAGETILLTKDIDINKDDDIGTVETEWDMDSGSVFEGYFNGQGHKISGFYDNRAGLFNNIGEDGIVTKLILDVNVRIEDGSDYSPLANLVGGKIMYCGIEGSIHITLPEKSRGTTVSGLIYALDALSFSNDSSLKFPLVSDSYTTANIELDNHTNKVSGIYGIFTGAYENPNEINSYFKNIYIGSTYTYKTATDTKCNYNYWPFIEGFYSKETIFANVTFLGDSDKWKTIKEENINLLTDDQAKDKSTYTNVGWDFNKVWNIDTEGYHDKIYLDTNQAPEGVETFIDDIGPYYYDSELKFVNNGYPYIRSDVLPPVAGNMERRMVTVSAVYPDMQIGYYEPATIKPEITITGIEGVEADQLKDFINQYKLEVTCPEYKQYLIEAESVGSTEELKENAKLTYEANDKYVFDIDFDKSTVTSGKLSAKSNSYKNIDTMKKAEAFLDLTEKGEKEALASSVTLIENNAATINNIVTASCWTTVLNLVRYDKLKDDPEIHDLLDRWFELEKQGFKKMYEEDRSMKQELTTVCQRELIAITAAGFDPADIKEYTKGTYGEDDPGFDLVQAVINEVGKEGAHMHVPFWLIALDSGDYATSSNHEEDVNNRVNMVYKLMKSSVFGAGSGIAIDYIGMFSQGLTKYINPEEGTIYYEVAQKVNEKLKADGKPTIAEQANKENVIAAIKKFQCQLGGWITYGNYNPASTAQAVTMLSCMGVDAYSEELTTEAGYSMLDSFIQAGCNLDENGLPVSIKDTYEMTMNKSFYSSQSIYATISWYRLMNNQTALYDCTDVVGVPQVEKMISNLPTEITLNDEKAIETAKAAYDALTKGQKKYVDNASVLEEASKKLAELKKAEEPTNPTQPTQPTKPVALKAATVKATATSYDKVKLTWKKVDGAESYKIYRSTSKSSGYKNVKTVKTLTWTDSKLTTGKTYYYKVEATAKNATSSTSKVVSAKPVLTVPSSVKATSSSYNKVTVTWKKVDGATGYKVYRATSKNGSYKKVATVKTLKWTDSKLKTGKTYYYKVRAYNKTANSGYSKVVNAKPVPAKTNLSSVKNAKSKKATLTWKKVDGATGYKVYRATKKNGSYKSVKTVKNVKTWTDSNLKKNKTYYYKVRAYKTVDGSKVYGAYSDVKSVTVK